MDQIRQIILKEPQASFRPHRVDDRMENLSFAAITALTDDASKVHEFVESEKNGDQAISSIMARERQLISDTSQAIKNNIRSINDQSIEVSSFEVNDHIDGLSLDAMVKLRIKHETRQARTGVRTRFGAAYSDKKTVAQTKKTVAQTKKEIARQMQQILQDHQGGDRGVGSGLERAQRWRAPAIGARHGVVDGLEAPVLAAGANAGPSVPFENHY
ncbi:hypothetical protein CVT24_010457 [Panaeolus cyanescens]|uniref:Uncharacterized protein n=1 Tax=Panaeolus cyanescens TaxID=181874 RepID=A0A409X2R1_9AGAR|nr:hypothetical protein CVT24_010457 [Panaeolus cyanescens]